MSFEVEAESYDRYVGRYVPALAASLADAAGVGPGMRVLDVGCGPGGLTAELVRRVGAASVAAIDPSESFVAACRTRNPGVDVRLGVAEELPFHDDEFDVALASLVIQFMNDAQRGVGEMARVSTNAVAGCVWDYTGGMKALRLFWDAARAVDDSPPDEEWRLAGKPGEIASLMRAVGLDVVADGELLVDAGYDDFDDWWDPFTFGIGPAGSYYRSLPSDMQDAIREECRRRLGDPHGPFRLSALAWYAVGRV